MTIAGRPYLFHNSWWLAATRETVLAALIDLADYPTWWVDVRAARRVDDDTAELVCQAWLPYRIVIRLRRAEQHERAGVLRVELSGDLRGYCGCVVSASAGGSRVDIIQRVTVHKTLLRRLDFVARPAFRVNHALMMRRGNLGLSRYLTR